MKRTALLRFCIAVSGIGALLTPTACGTPNPAESSAPGDADIVRSGHSIRGERVGTGAVVRASTDVTDIELEVTFLGADGDEIASHRDSLPHCPASTDCPWAQNLFLDELGDDREVTDIRVKIAEASETNDAPQPEILPVVRSADGIELRTEGKEGTLYVIVSEEGVPVFGYSTFTRAPDDELVLPGTLLPTRPGDEVSAVLYPGNTPDPPSH